MLRSQLARTHAHRFSDRIPTPEHQTPVLPIQKIFDDDLTSKPADDTASRISQVIIN
jgi:hypothetical protein